MSPFASSRERNLWLWTLVVLVAIYSTLGLAGRLAEQLTERDQELLSGAFFWVFVGTIAIGVWVKLRPGWLQVGVLVGVGAVYVLACFRVLGPAERTHLVEYGVVALLIHQALLERERHDRRVPAPSVLAVVATALLGWLDEGIQALLPNRVYELRDVGFNALAALMAVGSSWALGRVRRRDPGDLEPE